MFDTTTDFNLPVLYLFYYCVTYVYGGRENILDFKLLICLYKLQFFLYMVICGLISELCVRLDVTIRSYI